MKYSVNVVATENVEGVSIGNNRNSHQLYILWMKESKKRFNVSFKISNDSGSSFLVTGRDYSLYPENLRFHIDNLVREGKKFQYVEIGAGLGGFTPYVANYSYITLGPKPIVVDPLNYSAVRGLINYSLGMGIEAILKDEQLSIPINSRLKTFSRRCDALLSDRIIHIKSRVENAFRKNPDLIGLGDVVVDNFGAQHYSKNRGKTFLCERALAKERGVIFSSCSP